jgi:hypothetical protein
VDVDHEAAPRVPSMILVGAVASRSPSFAIIGVAQNRRRISSQIVWHLVIMRFVRSHNFLSRLIAHGANAGEEVSVDGAVPGAGELLDGAFCRKIQDGSTAYLSHWCD